eukprot:CAMPEP_0194753582 /NCGR_PEP_ID=MMETSP0323_2-20130528/7543_1 /TAXON_ID=2866 ORGANISM="Crypthecodinium cohnii, Strain Seligo" /NCGR_SAMPLE_ID=MMETSP0323_2 /ASSEMBLY_ACC=CAM_ASM_000346 /LENGTH=99 /DNA_ID=CAMNT_0039671531 /DNA_START=59 /DNA_END=358 /DNA_ORIENTATION=-
MNSDGINVQVNSPAEKQILHHKQARSALLEIGDLQAPMPHSSTVVGRTISHHSNDLCQGGCVEDKRKQKRSEKNKLNRKTNKGTTKQTVEIARRVSSLG